jgi:uncharacterized protein (TIGR03435 family)
VIEAVGLPMSTLLDSISGDVGRIVLDRTGFTELFNFRLEFAWSLDAGVTNVDTPASLRSRSGYTAMFARSR